MMFLHRLRVHLIPLYFIFYSGANSNSQTLAAFYELRPTILLTPHSQTAVTMPPSPSLGAVEMLGIVIDPVLCPYKYDESSMMGFLTSSPGRKRNATSSRRDRHSIVNRLRVPVMSLWFLPVPNT